MQKNNQQRKLKKPKKVIITTHQNAGKKSWGKRYIEAINIWGHYVAEDLYKANNVVRRCGDVKQPRAATHACSDSSSPWMMSLLTIPVGPPSTEARTPFTTAAAAAADNRSSPKLNRTGVEDLYRANNVVRCCGDVNQPRCDDSFATQ